MKRAIVKLVCGGVLAGLLAPATAWAQDGHGSIVAWGRNNHGQCNVPPPNTGFVAVAGGELHSLGLKGYSHALGDLNRDGALDAFDIDPFVVCLTTGICECP